MIRFNMEILIVSLMLSSLFESNLVLSRVLSNSSQFTSMQKKFQEEMLIEHNKYRFKHCVQPLVLNEKINRSAQDYAEKLLSENKFEHSDGNHQYGENLFFASTSSSFKDFQASQAVHSWYNEVQFYNYSLATYSDKTGHFSQLVWKNSKELGVGISINQNFTNVYIVAQYSPAGNYIDEFSANVFNPDSCRK